MMTACHRALLLLFLLLSAAAAHAQATTAPPSPAPATDSGALTPAQAAAALQALQDPKKRAQIIDTLRAIAETSRKTTPAPQATPMPQPASPQPAPPTAVKAATALTPDSLGAALLAQTSDWLKGASHEVALTARAVTDFPALSRWVRHVLKNPAARARAADAGWKLALVLGCALAFEWLAVLAVRRPIAALEATSPRGPVAGGGAPATSEHSTLVRRQSYLVRTPLLLRRLPWLLGRLVLELLPVVIFTIAAVLLLNTEIGSSTLTRRIILTAVNAYVLFRVIMCVARLLLSPSSERLRLLHVSGQTAAYAEVWVRRIAVIMVFGIALTRIALLLGLSLAAGHAMVKLVGLVMHLCLVIIVLQCRHGVANLIRARPDAHGGLALLRNHLGDVWHYIAIFFIMAQWVVWAVAIPNGFSQLLQFFLETVAVLVAARLIAILVLGTLDQIFHVSVEATERFPGLDVRANRYYPLLRGTVAAVILAVTIVALLEVWGVEAVGWLRKDVIGRRLTSAVITIGIAAIAAIIVWEGANEAIDRHLTRLAREAQLARSSRMRTLLPLLRSVLFIAVITVIGLTALSELGVNIAPLLAGAGIVGIAVGFGSQKLVQDLITGLFLLLENAMQVGDYVTVSGLSGTVENLSIRTIRLRAEDGAVHIIPFSSVTSVTNANRGVGNVAVNVSVAYKENIDQVGDVLKSIAAEMRTEPRFKSMMLSDLQLWGVDKVGPTGATIVGQIACTASGRWFVQREFNRRMTKRFKELGIELVNPP
jgi:small-conductance mechanosensitive channel